MELGLNPGWIDSQQMLLLGQEGSVPQDQNFSDGESQEFASLMDQFDPSLNELMNPNDEYKGLKSSEVTTQIMDSEESDSVAVAPGLVAISPLLVDLNKPVITNIKLDDETNYKTGKVLDDLDRLRLKFFMQDQPIFRGVQEQRVVDYGAMMKSPLESLPDTGASSKIETVSPILHPKEGEVTPPKELIGSLGQDFTEIDPSNPREVLVQGGHLELPKEMSAASDSEISSELLTDIEQSLPQGIHASEKNDLSGGDSNPQRESTERDVLQKPDVSTEAKSDVGSELVDQQMASLITTSKGIVTGKDTLVDPSAVSPQNQSKIDQAAELLIEQGGGTARIKLSPEGMGEIELRIRVQGDQVNVHFVADNVETKEMFEKSIEKLRNQLESQNLKVDSLNVQIAEVKSSQSTDSGRDQNQPNPNLGLLRDMMNQSRHESFARQSNMIADWDAIRTYGRSSQPPEPISSALESSRAKGARYLGDSRGQRLSLVG